MDKDSNKIIDDINFIKDKMAETLMVPKEYFQENRTDSNEFKISERFSEVLKEADIALSKQAVAYAHIMCDMLTYRHYVSRHMSVRKFKKMAKRQNVVNYREIVHIIKNMIAKREGKPVRYKVMDFNLSAENINCTVNRYGK